VLRASSVFLAIRQKEHTGYYGIYTDQDMPLEQSVSHGKRMQLAFDVMLNIKGLI
jgi:hypothetical protein